jgi:hypothetical protein
MVASGRGPQLRLATHNENYEVSYLCELIVCNVEGGISYFRGCFGLWRRREILGGMRGLWD